MFSRWTKREEEKEEVEVEYSKLTRQEIERREKELIDLANKYLSNKDWQQFQEGECSMYSLSFEGRVATKASMVLEFPVNHVIQFLKDPSSFKQTDLMMEEVRVLEAGEGFQIGYIKFKGIWPVAARDLTIYGIRKQVGDTFYLVSKSVPYHLEDQEGIVRAECHIGAYILQILGPSTTRVTYVSDADVKGMIPGFIKNMVSKHQASVPINLNMRLKQRAQSLKEKDGTVNNQEQRKQEQNQQVD